MWRGEDGTFHTVALPDPSELFTATAWASLDNVLDATDYADFAALIERCELAVLDYWEQRPVDGETEEPFVDQSPPMDLIDGVFSSLSELEAALQDVDPRWALDVATALDDLVEPA